VQGRSDSRQTCSILSQLDLLASCSLPLARACKEALYKIDDWFRLIDKKQRPTLEETTSKLQSALDDYHTERLETVKPFRHLFDPSHANEDPRYVGATRVTANGRRIKEQSFRALWRSTT
jgi:hypothetical protein